MLLHLLIVAALLAPQTVEGPQATPAAAVVCSMVAAEYHAASRSNDAPACAPRRVVLISPEAIGHLGLVHLTTQLRQ